MKHKNGNIQRNSRAGRKRLAALVFVALVALVAGILLLASIVRLPVPPERRAQAGAAASLNLSRPDASQLDLLRGEEARLFDPTPLFLPVRHNSSQTDDAAGARHEPGESLPLIEPRFVYSAGTFGILFPDPLPGPAQPAEVLIHGRTQTPYAQFGRLDPGEKPLPARLAQVEVVQIKTGRVLLALPLPAEPAPAQADGDAALPLPAALAAGDVLWRPLEFVVALDIAGQAGAPVLAQSSGLAEVDEFFANHITRVLRMGQRRELGAGFYIVRIGP